jgi:hypothetical protein
VDDNFTAIQALLPGRRSLSENPQNGTIWQLAFCPNTGEQYVMLEYLLYPKSIAVIGDSRTPGKVGCEILVNLLEGGFAGQIGGISVLLQSGAVYTAMSDWAAARHLSLAKMVSPGNKADPDETDFLSAFVAAEQEKVIVGYLESITSGDKFIEAARPAASVKPVILLRAGFTAEVLPDNKPVLEVLHKSSRKVRSHLKDDVYIFELDFV